MSKTGYYTGAEEISASSGDFSTTDSITPNYTNGWAQMGSDVFSVPSSGSLPSGVPGNSNDVDLSDANEVMLVTVRIKDINMLSATGVPRIPSYPFCIFPNDFNVLNDWSGELYRGRNTKKIKDYDSEADAKADATLARPDTWVWYDGKWVSLIGNNPEDTFYKYADWTNSTSGQTEYFRHITAKENKGENSRYIERARVRLSKSTISSKFVTTYNGTRCAMMLLIPFKATEYTLDAVGSASNFSNTQVFYAVDDIGNTLYNVDAPNDIPTYYKTQDDSTEWTRLPGFYRNVSNAQGEMPYFKKAKTYTYLTAFNVASGEQLDISKHFNSGNAEGVEENIAKATWIPYQRTDPISVEATDDKEMKYVVWNDDTGGWELTDAETYASTERRMLGIIIQAPGGSGGPGGVASRSGGGGGGGAFCELMVNAYRNYIRVNLSKTKDWGQTPYPCFVEVWRNASNRVCIRCNGGQGGYTSEVSSNGSGGAGGTVEYGIYQNEKWTFTTIANNKMAVVPTSTETGDKNTVKWYSPNGVGNFSWDTPNIGVVAAVAGGDGGHGGFASTAELRKDPEEGKSTFKTQKYYVAGIPSKALTWNSELDPYDSSTPGNSPGGTYGVTTVSFVSGGGGGASYYGYGGMGGSAEGYEPKKGGGAGGSGNDTSGWRRGAEGVFLLLK